MITEETMPDGRPVCSVKKCSKCGCEIHTGDGWFIVSDGYVCGQCNYLHASNRLKPTLGVIPKNQWIERRIFSLAKAIEARSAQVAANPNDSDTSPLVEWAQEIAELVAEARKAGKS